MLIGYARCSTRGQDLRVQRSALKHLGVDTERIYTDQGRTGRNRDRPGLREALAACRAGDTIVVTKLDRLGRSAVDLHTIARELEQKQTRISIGGALHDPTDPTGKLFYGMLALMAEFESDLIRARTKEAMAIAKAEGTAQRQTATAVGSATQTPPRRLRLRRLQQRPTHGNQRTIRECPINGGSGLAFS